LQVAREKFRLASERLLHIILWQPDADNPLSRQPLNKDVIDAAKNFAMLDLALVQAEIANGLYKKPIEQLTEEVHYEPLPAEVRTVVIAAWQRGGLLPKATVE